MPGGRIARRAAVTNVSNKRIFMCVESLDRPRRDRDETRAARSHHLASGRVYLVFETRNATGRHDLYFCFLRNDCRHKDPMCENGGYIVDFFHCQ